jgi:hypothetical protein
MWRHVVFYKFLRTSEGPVTSSFIMNPEAAYLCQTLVNISQTVRSHTSNYDDLHLICCLCSTVSTIAQLRTVGHNGICISCHVKILNLLQREMLFRKLKKFCWSFISRWGYVRLITVKDRSVPNSMSWRLIQEWICSSIHSITKFNLANIFSV